MRQKWIINGVVCLIQCRWSREYSREPEKGPGKGWFESELRESLGRCLLQEWA
jgi:hypothetical protein